MHTQRRDDAALVDCLVLALLFVVASALLLLAPVGSTLRRLQKGIPPTSEARGDPLKWLGDTLLASIYKNARCEQSAAAAADAAGCLQQKPKLAINAACSLAGVSRLRENWQQGRQGSSA